MLPEKKLRCFQLDYSRSDMKGTQSVLLFLLPIKHILCKSDEEKLAVSQEMTCAEKYSAASNAVKRQ